MNLLLALMLALLSSDDFRERERGQALLDALPWPLAAPLARPGAADDPEASARLAARQEAHLKALAEAGRLYPPGWRCHPWGPADWIDYAYCDERRGRALQGPPSWCDYRLATESLVRAMARSGYGAAGILDELGRLAEADRAWCHAHGRLCEGDGARRLR